MKDKIKQLLEKYYEALKDSPYNTEHMDYSSGYNNGRNITLQSAIIDLQNLLNEDNK